MGQKGTKHGAPFDSFARPGGWDYLEGEEEAVARRKRLTQDPPFTDAEQFVLPRDVVLMIASYLPFSDFRNFILVSKEKRFFKQYRFYSMGEGFTVSSGWLESVERQTEAGVSL
jgi:hypothetical protein